MDDQAQRPDGAGDGAEAAGRAQVRALLIGRLDEAGLRRGHGVSVDAHEARVARVVDALSYMTGPNLMTLAELVLQNAAGGYRDSWPPEVAVVAWGHALQRPPLKANRIIHSWLASVEGPPARAAGQHVQLYRFLRRTLKPPQGHDRNQIRIEAEQDARRIVLYQERIAAGTARPEERAWVEAYLRDRAQAEAIIDAGDAARRDRGAADAA